MPVIGRYDDLECVGYGIFPNPNLHPSSLAEIKGKLDNKTQDPAELKKRIQECMDRKLTKSESIRETGVSQTTFNSYVASMGDGQWHGAVSPFANKRRKS